MRDHTAAITALIIMGTSGVALGQDHGVVIVPPIRDEARVVTVAADLADLDSALLGDGQQDWQAVAGRLSAALDDGTPLPCQADVDAAGVGVIALYMQQSDTEQRVALSLEGGALSPEAPVGRISIDQNAESVVVTGPTYRVTHSAGSAWLPSSIEFLPSGKIFDSFGLNDRIHHPDRGGFVLRHDREATVRIIAEGPLRVAVEVTAHYVADDGSWPEGEPMAVYTFEYVAGLSEVRVRAKVSQQSDVEWSELHLLEINFPDESFMHYATGGSDGPQPLTGEEAAYSGTNWGALVEGDDVLAIVGGPVKIWDGRGGYGAYLHGPWTNLPGREWTGEALLWIGSSPDALRMVARQAEQARASGSCRLSTTTIERLADEAREAATTDEGWRAWAVELVQGLANSVGLTTTQQILADLPAALKGDQDGIPVINTPEGALWLAHNGRIGLGLRQGPGELRLVSIRDLVREREFAPPGGCPIFRVHTSEADGPDVVLSPQEGWGEFDTNVRMTDDTVDEITWTLSGHNAAPDITATLTARWDGDRVDLSLAVSNASATRWISKVDFPAVALGPTGDPADDAIIYPSVSGNITQAPLLNGAAFQGRYPSGWCTMQFLAQYDAESGLYVGCHDPLATTKEIRMEADTGLGETRIWFENWAEDDTRPGNSFSSSGVATLQLFEGDWYDAARIHRAWAESEAGWWPDHGERRVNSSAVADGIDVWALASGTPAEVVDRVKEFADYVGVPTALHWYSWHEIPFDVDYPHYFPTKEGFADGVAELQAAGIRVMPYINGRLWDTGSDDFDSIGRAGAAKQPSGEVYIEEYGSGAKLAPMCPTTGLWQTTVQDIVLRLMGPEVGVDGVYIDQVAAAAPALCYDPTHGHPLGGGSHWTEGGYWPMLTDLRARMDEGKFLTTECNGDPYTHVFDEYLTWHWQYPGQLPMFSAVYGGQVHMFGRSYSGDALAIRMKAGQQLVFGEQVGWISPDAVKDVEVGPFFRDVARMRHALHEYFVDGEMARPPVLEGDIPQVTSDWVWGGSMVVTTDAVLSGAWRAADGRLATIFANVSDEAVSMTWRFDGAKEGLGDGEVTVIPRVGDDIGPQERVSASFERAVTVEARQVLAFIVNSVD